VVEVVQVKILQMDVVVVLVEVVNKVVVLVQEILHL
jgi:hypothetical protein